MNKQVIVIRDMFPTGVWIPIGELNNLPKGEQVKILLKNRGWAIHLDGLFTQTGDGLYPKVNYTSGLSRYCPKGDRFFDWGDHPKPSHFLILPELK